MHKQKQLIIALGASAIGAVLTLMLISHEADTLPAQAVAQASQFTSAALSSELSSAALSSEASLFSSTPISSVASSAISSAQSTLFSSQSLSSQASSAFSTSFSSASLTSRASSAFSTSFSSASLTSQASSQTSFSQASSAVSFSFSTFSVSSGGTSSTTFSTGTTGDFSGAGNSGGGGGFNSGGDFGGLIGTSGVFGGGGGGTIGGGTSGGGGGSRPDASAEPAKAIDCSNEDKAVADCIPLIQPLGNRNTIAILPGPASFIDYFNSAANLLLTAAIGFCVLWILIGSYLIMISGSDGGKRSQGKDIITWAVIGLILVNFAGFFLRTLNSIFFV